QRFLQQLKYSPIRQNNNFKHYAKVFRFKKYAICDILILTTAVNMEDAEAQVLELDAECQRVRRSIMLGRFIMRSFQVQKHHFMKLKKSFSLYSYKNRDLPTGFLIRPLILLKQENQWDYIMGETTRVDIISQDNESFNLYIQQHQEYLESQRDSLISLKKFRYWKVASLLLDYGHYPIVGFWFLDLVYALLDKPFPFKLGGMIFITAMIYSIFLGITYFLYNSFKRCQINELKETAYSILTTAQEPNIEIIKSTLPQEVDIKECLPSQNGNIEELSLNQPALSEELTVEEVPSSMPPTTFKNLLSSSEFTSPSIRRIPSIDRLYKSRIQKHITLLLNSKESKIISIQAQSILQKTFCWILGRTSQGIPRNATLTELLKNVRDNPTIKRFFTLLKLWVGKLDTQTPFAQDEIRSFKKFLLEFLYELELLPQELVLAVEGKLATKTVLNTMKEEQKSEQNEIKELKSQIEKLKKQMNGTKTKQVETQKQTPIPNLEIASVPQNLHTEISRIDAPRLQIIRKNDPNSVYCTILIDAKDPNTPNILSQFYACTKDLDVRRNYIDVQWLNNTFIKQEFTDYQPPAVLIGRGLNSQVIPFGEMGDDTRLHSVVENYFQSRSQIILKERKENEYTNDNKKDSMINNQPIGETASSQNSVIPHNPEKDINSKEFQVFHHPPDIPLNQQQMEYILALSTHLPFFEPGCIMIDGSNVAHLYKDYGIAPGPQVDCVIQTVKTITSLGIPQDRISIYFDSNFYRFKLKNYPTEQQKFVEYKNQGIFRVVPSRTEADTAFIQGGIKLKQRFIVISKDQFRDKPDWFRSHRVGIGLSPDNTPYLAVNSPKELIMAFYGKECNFKEGGLKPD
ncbi:MAG: hypothetical protein ACFFD2_11300, partial [Promethearchaeota archaeon]